MKEGWLSPMRVLTVQTKQKLDDVDTSEGDFVMKQLEQKVNNNERNSLILEAYKSVYKERKSTLVFAVNIKHVIDLTEEFKQVNN